MTLALPDPALARLAAARALARALLMGGWIGLTHLAERYTADAMQSYTLVAGWLLALGIAATLAARLTANAWLLRALLLACAVVAARGMLMAVQGGGAALLWPALLAWALLVALASTTVRRCAWPCRHTLLGNGAYNAPDLTKSWLDPSWGSKDIREQEMVAFLMNPQDRLHHGLRRRMPNLNITEAEARATVAFLKWMSSIDTNGFPANFVSIDQEN